MDKGKNEGYSQFQNIIINTSPLSEPSDSLKLLSWWKTDMSGFLIRFVGSITTSTLLICIARYTRNFLLNPENQAWLNLVKEFFKDIIGLVFIKNCDKVYEFIVTDVTRFLTQTLPKLWLNLIKNSIFAGMTLPTAFLNFIAIPYLIYKAIECAKLIRNKFKGIKIDSFVDLTEEELARITDKELNDKITVFNYELSKWQSGPRPRYGYGFQENTHDEVLYFTFKLLRSFIKFICVYPMSIFYVASGWVIKIPLKLGAKILFESIKIAASGILLIPSGLLAVILWVSYGYNKGVIKMNKIKLRLFVFCDKVLSYVPDVFKDTVESLNKTLTLKNIFIQAINDFKKQDWSLPIFNRTSNYNILLRNWNIIDIICYLINDCPKLTKKNAGDIINIMKTYRCSKITEQLVDQNRITKEDLRDVTTKNIKRTMKALEDYVQEELGVDIKEETDYNKAKHLNWYGVKVSMKNKYQLIKEVYNRFSVLFGKVQDYEKNQKFKAIKVTSVFSPAVTELLKLPDRGLTPSLDVPIEVAIESAIVGSIASVPARSCNSSPSVLLDSTSSFSENVLSQSFNSNELHVWDGLPQNSQV